MLGCNCFLRHLRKVVPTMPAVGDHDRLRRADTGDLGMRTGTVAADPDE